MPRDLHLTISAEDGALWAIAEEFPGVFATGNDLEELRKSLEEGISFYLAKPGGPAAAIRLGAVRTDAVRPDPMSARANLAYA